MSRSRSAVHAVLGCTLLAPAFLAFNQAQAAPGFQATPGSQIAPTAAAVTPHIGLSAVGNTITFTPAAEVSAVRIQITSARGAQLYNSGWMTGFDAGLGAVTWQALDDKGDLLPAGLYLTQVEARGVDGTTQTESGSLQLDAAPVTTRSGVTPRDTTITGTGTPNRVVLWLTASTVGDSIITQTSSSALSVAGSLTVTNTITTKTVNATNSNGNALVGNSNTGTALAGITQTGNGVLGTSTSANGVRGVSGTGIGVRGDSNNGTFGIQGNSNGAPVEGSSSTPVGVEGNANNSKQSIGVRGTSTIGIGVSGVSSKGIGVSGAIPGAGDSTFAVVGTVTMATPEVDATAVRGINNGTGSNGFGVWGSQNGTGTGVYGFAPKGTGVYGISNQAVGIRGLSNATSNDSSAIIGTMGSIKQGSGSAGVRGLNNGEGTNGYGVYGSQNGSGIGVYGSTPSGVGVAGVSDSGTAISGGSRLGNGVGGISGSSGYGVSGSSVSGNGIQGSSTSGYAGYFDGKVHITGNLEVGGTLSKSGGSFRIDDPLDPANKYLYHSFVESPDMMNLYNGTVTLDTKGHAVVTMPTYFSALNRDFRYQLTPIGAPAPSLYVLREIKNNTFEIAGGKPSLKVSWLVTGVRRDPWANDHRIPTQQLKTGTERGRYLYPAGYHKPESLSVDHLVAKPSIPQGAHRDALKILATKAATKRPLAATRTTQAAATQQPGGKLMVVAAR